MGSTTAAATTQTSKHRTLMRAVKHVYIYDTATKHAMYCSVVHVASDMNTCIKGKTGEMSNRENKR